MFVLGGIFFGAEGDDCVTINFGCSASSLIAQREIDRQRNVGTSYEHLD